MRIAFVSECYPSPERPEYCGYLEHQAQALARLGHIVETIVPIVQNNVKADEQREQNGIVVRNVYIRRRKIDKIYAQLKNRLQRANIEWQNYDVVSIHIVSNALCEAIVRECNNAGVPAVMHFHGLNVWKDYYQKRDPYHIFKHSIETVRKEKYLKKMDAIVGVSEKVCSVVRQRVADVPCNVVYNGVDSEFFNTNQEKCKTNDSFVILCVANLIPIKGHRYLLRAVANMIAKGNNISVRLIGVGSELDNLKELCKELNISDFVKFLGAKQYDVVAEEMRCSDMFIMPSYYEALGCVYLEAMCSGTVTCGCYENGIEEIIRDKQDGILVSPQNEVEIEEAIQLVIENPSLAKEMAANGVQRAMEFSWESSAIQLEKVYQQILKGRKEKAECTE